MNRARLFRFRGLVPVPLLLAQWALAEPVNWEIYWLGLGLGEVLRFWAAGHISRSSRTKGSDVDFLVVRGPFAHVRNPIYLGNMLQWVGLGGLCGPGWAAAWLVLGAVLYGTLVPWEEKQLARRWPEQFNYWANSVWRWTPHLEAGGSPPRVKLTRWRPGIAIASEWGTWLMWGVVTLAFMRPWAV
jgi:protein-S-isoprenylcysteine O-methyltransferase Ste14